MRKEPSHLYYVSHRKLGYHVCVTYSLKDARLKQKGLGKDFAIYDETGKEVR